MTEKDLEIQELRRELQAYKDTGLKPGDVSELMGSLGNAISIMADYHLIGDAGNIEDIDHIHGLLKAEKDGRLVVLPCNAGELWYSKDSGRPIEIDGFRYESYAGFAVLYHYPGWGKGSCNPSYFLEHFTQDKTAAALKKGGGHETDIV